MITPGCRFLRLVQTIFAISVFVFSSFAHATPSPTPAPPGSIDEKLFSGMQWRQIGPFRGGRALTVEGVPGEPDTYYFGAVAGGVWKMIEGGVKWHPLFDKQPISAIAGLANSTYDARVRSLGWG